MAELGENSTAFWQRVVLAVTIFVLFFVLLFLWLTTQYEIDTALATSALQHCPFDTFFSGRLYAHWVNWAGAALFLAIILLGLNALSHLKTFPKTNRLEMPWKARGVYGLFACIMVAITFIWFSDSTVFCVATSGIYSQPFPAAAFRKHEWQDVRQITVDCGYGRHGTETSYVLDMNGGGKIDIADAWPMPGPVWPPDSAYYEFRKKLDNGQFRFAANIRPDCSKRLVNWVSQRP